MGYCIPFLSHPPLSPVPIPIPSYNPLSTKGVALEKVTLGLVTKGAVEFAPLPSLGFYSRLFVVWKTSGSWRPVIDLSTLNRFVDVSHFQMETIQSVLLSVRPGDWMASIDLRDAYLQVPVHPESRPFLRFVSNGHVYQFKALCFDLSTAPQVLSRVMAPVSAILHSMGIRMRRYLDDWLVQSSSRESLLWDLQTVLGLCHELGVVDQPGETPPHSIPGGTVSRCGDQHPVFCGFSIARSHFQAAINRRRISVLRLASRELMALSAGDAFFAGSPGSWRQTAYAVSPAVPQQVMESCRPLASCGLVRGVSSGLSVVATPASPLPRCVPPPGVSRPRLLVRRLGHRVGCSSGSPRRFLWDLEQASLSINARELLAIQHSLLHFQSSLRGHTVAVFCDNVTAVTYLRKEGGTRSPLLNNIAQGILRWSESLAIRLTPQFIPGSNNVLADALSHPHQLPHSEWSLNMTVFRSLCR